MGDRAGVVMVRLQESIPNEAIPHDEDAGDLVWTITFGITTLGSIPVDSSEQR